MHATKEILEILLITVSIAERILQIWTAARLPRRSA